MFSSPALCVLASFAVCAVPGLAAAEPTEPAPAATAVPMPAAPPALEAAPPVPAPPVAPAVPKPAAVERDRKGVINLAKPLNLRWYALLEMGLPGLGGVRLGAEAYLPTLPVFAAVQFARDWGIDPSHNAGVPDTVMTRFMTGTRTWEARAGFLLRDWVRKSEEVYYDYDHGSSMGRQTWTRASYELDAPGPRAIALYAGWRYREVPGSETCQGLKFAANCAATQSTFLMVGILRTLSFDLDVKTKEHGALEWSNNKSVDLHLLYAPDSGQWGRGSLAKRIGLEYVVIQGKPDMGGAVHYGFGWDGQYVLLQGGLGFGGSKSFVGEARSAREIPLSD